MTTPMEDGDYPHFLVMNDVINTIELEPVYRRPAHVRKPNPMKQRRLAQRLNRMINFVQKFIA